MIPAPCEYERPSSLPEAIEALRRNGSAARLLAGGQSLIPMMKAREARPRVLIDITGLSELRDIAQTVGSVRIGALATHAEIEESADLAHTLPIMREAALQIGDPMIRNRGTFGGSLAHADPGADWPAVTLALDAAVHASGPRGERVISIDDLFTGERDTALDPDELLTHVAIPVPEGRVGMAYLKLRHFASGYALVGAAAVVTMDGEGTCRTCRLAITGAGPHAVRAAQTERMLEGQRPTPDIITSAAGQASEGMRFLSDVYASETYRARLVNVYARRALELAFHRCSNNITTLYIVRHGESLDNAGIPYVRTAEGSPLTERGRQQAHEVAQRLAGVGADSVISSDLLRARQTAEIIAKDLGLEVRVVPGLHERSIGPFAGRTGLHELEEYREKFNEYERGTNEEKMRWSLGEGWESLEEAQRRFVTAVERVADDYPGKTAIVVAHGTVMRTFLIYTGYGTLDELVEDVIQNTGYIVVETDGKRFTVREVVGLRDPSLAGRLEQ